MAVIRPDVAVIRPDVAVGPPDVATPGSTGRDAGVESSAPNAPAPERSLFLDTTVHRADSATHRASGDPAARSDGPDTGGRFCWTLELAASLVLLAWTFWVLRRWGALGPGAVYLGFTSVAFLGTGHLALRLARLEERGLTWLGLRYVVGFALCAFVITLLGSAGHAGVAVWLILAVGLAGWGLAAWELGTRRQPRPRRSLIGGELLIGAALLRVTISGSVFWQSGRGTSFFTQYHDMLFHLALVKSGIVNGLPLRGFVLESGVPQIGYHPAFDSTASVLIKGLHLPVDTAFFYLVLPVTLLGMLVGIGVLAAAWAHSRRAALLALGFVGLTLAVTTWPSAAVTALGDLGLNNVRYFLDNPPSVMSAVASTACLALLALADRRRSAGVYVVAGLLAGATTMMKANFAIVLVPAFVLALAVPVLRGRRAWPAAAAGIGAAVLAGAVSYPTTRGPAGALALGIGTLGQHLAFLARGEGALHGFSVLFTAPARALDGLGPTGSALIVLLYLAIVPLGLWLLITVAATWRARVAGERPFGRSPATSLTVLILVCLTVLVALFVTQRGMVDSSGDPGSWNVTWHTIQNLWWVGLCAAAVALDAALVGRRSSATVAHQHDRLAIVGRGLAGVAAVVLLAFSVHGIAVVRLDANRALLPTDLRVLLERADSYVPANLRVVQERDTSDDNWVSALAGRGAVLERSNLTRWVYPKRTARLERGIAVLYSTRDPATARRVAAYAQAAYAVINLQHNAAPGLRAISTVVARQGDWALLRLR